MLKLDLCMCTYRGHPQSSSRDNAINAVVQMTEANFRNEAFIVWSTISHHCFWGLNLSDNMPLSVTWPVWQAKAIITSKSHSWTIIHFGLTTNCQNLTRQWQVNKIWTLDKWERPTYFQSTKTPTKTYTEPHMSKSDEYCDVPLLYCIWELIKHLLQNFCKCSERPEETGKSSGNERMRVAPQIESYCLLLSWKVFTLDLAEIF